MHMIDVLNPVSVIGPAPWLQADPTGKLQLYHNTMGTQQTPISVPKSPMYAYNNST